jgi:hypothetical protein
LYAQAGIRAAVKKSSHIAELKAAKTRAAKVLRRFGQGLSGLTIALGSIDLLTQINVAYLFA